MHLTPYWFSPFALVKNNNRRCWQCVSRKRSIDFVIIENADLADQLPNFNLILSSKSCSIRTLSAITNGLQPKWVWDQVNTCWFYQACKVHDIVCFGDQSTNAEKSLHLSLRPFCQKLVCGAKRNQRLQSSQSFSFCWTYCNNVENPANLQV